jgi:hypothetical protein
MLATAYLHNRQVNRAISALLPYTGRDPSLRWLLWRCYIDKGTLQAAAALLKPVPRLVHPAECELLATTILKSTGIASSQRLQLVQCQKRLHALVEQADTGPITRLHALFGLFLTFKAAKVGGFAFNSSSRTLLETKLAERTSQSNLQVYGQLLSELLRKGPVYVHFQLLNMEAKRGQATRLEYTAHLNAWLKKN